MAPPPGKGQKRPSPGKASGSGTPGKGPRPKTSGDTGPPAKKSKVSDSRKYPKPAAPGKPKFALNGGKPKFAIKVASKHSQVPGTQPSSDGSKPVAAAKLTRQDQKEKVIAKNLAIKKNFGLIQDAVVLWEALRLKETSPEEKQELVAKIMSKVDGKLVELTSHHTASRIIQFCARHGTEAQRAKILDQVKANILALSKSKYGHHVVCKLISMAPKDQVPGLVRLFQGHAAELLRHPHGADVMTDLYDVAPAASRNAICAEFYGREFALFGGVSTQGVVATNLASLLKDQGATKRRSVMKHMTKSLVPIMEKAILHPPMVHRLLRDFIECAPSSSVEDAVDTLAATGAALLKMVHTHEGATVVCSVLAYGSARDRKRVIKAMKGYVRNLAVNEWGHVVLMTALSVVDDTKVLATVVGAELKAMIDEAVEDSHAIHVFLQLLSPDNPRYQPPANLAMLHPPTRIVQGTGKMVTELEDGLGEDGDGMEDNGHGMDVDGDDDDDLFSGSKSSSKGSKKSAAGKAKGSKAEEAKSLKAGKAKQEQQSDDEADETAPGGERVLGFSKKGVDARRKEVMAAGGAESLAKVLTQAVADSAGGLLRLPHACDLVVEVARGGQAGILLELAPQGVEAVHEALLVEASQPAPTNQAATHPTDSAAKGKKRKADPPVAAQPEQGEEQGQQGPGVQAEHVFTHWHASRALRRLLLASGEETAAANGTGAAARFATALWTRACAGRCSSWVGTHAEKVLAALLRCGVPSVQAAAAKELGPLVAPKSLESWSSERLAGTQHHAGNAVKNAKQAAGAKVPPQEPQLPQQAAGPKHVAANGTPATNRKGKKTEVVADQEQAGGQVAKRKTPAKAALGKGKH